MIVVFVLGKVVAPSLLLAFPVLSGNTACASNP